MRSREAIGPAQKRGDESAREGPTLFGPSLAWLWSVGSSMCEERQTTVRATVGRRAIGSVIVSPRRSAGARRAPLRRRGSRLALHLPRLAPDQGRGCVRRPGGCEVQYGLEPRRTVHRGVWRHRPLAAFAEGRSCHVEGAEPMGPAITLRPVVGEDLKSILRN